MFFRKQLLKKRDLKKKSLNSYDIGKVIYSACTYK